MRHALGRFGRPSRHRFATALIAALVVCPAVPATAADWMRLKSANFTVEGDVGERQLREVARRFEEFRAVFGRLLPNARLVTPTPLTVVVFAFDREFKPVRPLFGGKPVEGVGFALGSPVGTSVAICLEAGPRAYPFIYHEYGHLLINNAVSRLPLWASEGLAEYYSTFEMSADGKKAIVGRPLSGGELGLMSNRYLIPLSELLSAGHDSRLYNVSSERGRFYVQSWALVHYLLLGSPGRKGQFNTYVNRVASGAQPDQAFAETITDAGKLEEELTRYVGQFAFGAIEYRFPERVAGDQTYSAQKMSPAEVECTFGHLLLRQQRYEEAGARFTAALRLDPTAASAHTGLGLIDVSQGRIIEGVPSLRKGVEHGGGDVLAHYALGLAALQCESSECQKQEVGDELARKEFLRAIELQPEFPDALSFLGYTELDARVSLDEAERHLIAAVKLLPGREDYRLHLAQVYLARKEREKAQALLGPIAAGSPNAGYKSQARTLLGQLSAIQNRPALDAISSLGEPPPPPAGAATGTDRPAAGSGRVIPVYRRVQDGERRVEGTLESIECPRSGAFVVVRDASGLHRFTASSLDKIEFLTYRDDLKGSITCGPQPGGMRVYVTYTPIAAGAAPSPAGTEGVVVAVEYLPRDK
jgi:tetratricopeptide (TPR) repeat protein